MPISAQNRTRTADRLCSAFRDKYKSNPRIFHAPGRVNLIGEHTDYNSGFVMPMAINAYTWCAIAAGRDRSLEVYSDLFNEQIHLSLNELSGPTRRHWSDFVRGVAATMQNAGHVLSAANLTIHSEVPLGAGLSSSAALEVAVAIGLAAISRLDISRLEIAKLCQKAEHEYVGTRCGIMDQFAATFSKADHALMLDCRSLDYRLLPVPSNLRLVVCNSMVRHELASGEYNQRRADCEIGVKLLQSYLPEITALRDVSIGDLEKHRAALPERIYHRCLHIVTENQRLIEAIRALEVSDAEKFGRLMYQSHASLRDDYEVSCQELDLLVEKASALPGVFGARMTGGGFGGCTINLVRAESAPQFQSSIAQMYTQATGIVPTVWICEPAEGAREYTTESCS